MDKYFEIKANCKLYNEYFAYKKDETKMVDAFNLICDKFEIETKRFRTSKETLWIDPTFNDLNKFNSIMKRTNYGEFRKNSEPSKMWRKLTKDIEHFERPRLLFYFDLLGYRWRERLFHIRNKLYCSISSDGEISAPDFAIEMKASEFYKIIEEEENKENYKK